MPTISRGIRETEEILRDAKVIRIPYALAQLKFKEAVAMILDQREHSSATEAKDKAPETFKWFLMYVQPKDPTTRDQSEFVRILGDRTRVFLVCRGFRWKGVAELKAMLPEQIRTRYEERARIVCSEPLVTPSEIVETPPPKEKRKVVGKSLDEDINSLISSLTALTARHHVDTGYVRIAEMALRSLKSSSTKRMS